MNDSNLNEALREFEAENYDHPRSLMEGLTDKKEVKLQLAYLYQHGLGGPSES